MYKGISFVGGFVIGAMIGAAVAVFVAPQSGEEFQKQIRERLDAVRAGRPSRGRRTPRRARGAVRACQAVSEAIDQPDAVG